MCTMKEGTNKGFGRVPEGSKRTQMRIENLILGSKTNIRVQGSMPRFGRVQCLLPSIKMALVIVSARPIPDTQHHRFLELNPAAV